MRYRPGHGDPLGIAHVPDVPLGALPAGANTVILERRSVRAAGPPIAESAGGGHVAIRRVWERKREAGNSLATRLAGEQRRRQEPLDLLRSGAGQRRLPAAV